MDRDAQRTAGDTAESGALVRPVRPTDLAAIHEIRLQPLNLLYTMALPSERLSEWGRRLENLTPDDHLLVVELGGRVVGMGGLHLGRGKRRHSAELGMGIHDAYHGLGLGRHLLSALLGIADDLCLHRVTLEVMADNAAAVRLYERHGFVHEGRLRDSVLRAGGPVDVLVMGRLRGDGA